MTTTTTTMPLANRRRIGIWTYLVAYVARGGVAGNAVTTRPCPIDSDNEIRNVESWLRTGGIHGAIITNVVLLKRRRFARWVDRGSKAVRREDPVLN